MKRRVVKASTQVEGKSDQGEVAVIPRPMVTAAAPSPPPATAAVAPHPPPLLQHLLAVPHDPPPHEGRGGVAALRLTRLADAAAATAPIGTAVIVARRAGTGGGAALRDQAATRKTAVIPGSAGGGVGPDPERETGAEPGLETPAAAAETERRRKTGIRRGKGAGNAGIVVIVIAANTSRRPPAKTGRGGETGVVAMRKIRKKRIKTRIGIGRKSLIKREKNQRPKIKKRRRKREAL